ncbi:MAG: hypothetical protein ACHQIK_14730, partial [Candidatus Acidiferrales bacterium]
MSYSAGLASSEHLKTRVFQESFQLCICAGVLASGSLAYEHLPYIHESSTLVIRRAASNELLRARFR